MNGPSPDVQGTNGRTLGESGLIFLCLLTYHSAGPSISPIQAPSHPPSVVPKNNQRNHATSPYHQGNNSIMNSEGSD